jgi:hypothetical protein
MSDIVETQDHSKLQQCQEPQNIRQKRYEKLPFVVGCENRFT